MMLNRIALIASLLIFLFGVNVFADTTSTTVNSDHSRLSHSLIIKASKAEPLLKQNQTASTELKKAEPTIKNYVIPAFVGVFIILLFCGYWFVLRKRLFAK